MSPTAVGTHEPPRYHPFLGAIVRNVRAMLATSSVTHGVLSRLSVLP